MGPTQTKSDLSENREAKPDRLAKRGAFCLSVYTLRSDLMESHNLKPFRVEKAELFPFR